MKEHNSSFKNHLTPGHFIIHILKGKTDEVTIKSFRLTQRLCSHLSITALSLLKLDGTILVLVCIACLSSCLIYLKL